MCQSCEVLNINGMNCHEHGCPGAWQDEVRHCAWCGQEFKPETKHQICCDEICMDSYCGY